MAAKAHAILSASSSDRWLHCPPSARLCETYEDKGSDYAAEGTDAHGMPVRRGVKRSLKQVVTSTAPAPVRCSMFRLRSMASTAICVKKAKLRNSRSATAARSEP